MGPFQTFRSVNGAERNAFGEQIFFAVEVVVAAVGVVHEQQRGLVEPFAADVSADLLALGSVVVSGAPGDRLIVGAGEAPDRTETVANVALGVLHSPTPSRARSP